MSIYLAGSYHRREELLAHAEELRAAGCTVVCRWLDGAHETCLQAKEVEESFDSMPRIARAFAEADLMDLDSANVVICFTERPDSPYSRGGRHVEFGIAYAKGKAIFCIGPRENVFYTLPEVIVFDSWKEFRKKIILKEEQPKEI
jgi:nucleoside 2-deoxyribosyltransferase